MNAALEKFLVDYLNPLPNLISPRELSATGLVSLGTLAKLRSKESGPAFLKMGEGQVKYLKEDILNWFRNCYRPGKVKNKKGKTDDMQLKFDY